MLLFKIGAREIVKANLCNYVPGFLCCVPLVPVRMRPDVATPTPESEPVCPAYFRARTRSEAQHPRLHQNVGWRSRPGTTETKPPGGLERPACAHASGSAVWRALQLSVRTHSPVSSVPSLPRADLCEFPSPRGRSRQRQSRGIIAAFLPSRVAPHCKPCRVETR